MGMDTRKVENEAYAAFCARVVRSLGDRVGDGDPEDCVHLRKLAVLVREAEGRAVQGLLAQGHSYATIGAALGISRQAVHQLEVKYRHTQHLGNSTAARRR